MPDIFLTDLGVAKITAAAGSGSEVAISEVALGDANGAGYAPVGNETVLVNERVRQPIEFRALVQADTWYVRALFPPGAPVFDMREVGFFDAEGDLICIWAGLDVEPRRIGVVEYVSDHFLNFGAATNGPLTIAAPDWDLFQHAVEDLRAHAVIGRLQVQTAIKVYELERRLPA